MRQREINCDRDPSRPSPDEMPGVLVLWTMVRRRYLLLGSSIFAGLLLAAAYYWLSKPSYESSTQILVIKKQATLPGHNSDAQRDFEQTVGEDLLATHILILKSPRVVQDALPTLVSKFLFDVEHFVMFQ